MSEHNAPIPPKRSPAVGITLIGATLLFSGLFLAGWLGKQRSGGHLDAMAQEVSGGAQLVTVTTPRHAQEEGMALPGSIQAIEETVIGSRTSGYLRRRYVDIGSRVKAGDLLAEIEAPEIDQQAAQAEADTAKSRANAAQARAEVARSQAGVEQARSETHRLEANVDQARANLSRAKAKVAQAEAATASARAKLTVAEQTLAGRRADLAQSQSQLTIALKSVERWRQLMKQGAVSAQELDERESTYDASRARVDSSQAAIASAQADVQAAREAVRASEADREAAEADVAANQQAIRAAQEAVRTNLAMVGAAKAGVTASRSSVQAGIAQIESSQANVRRYTALRGFERVTAPFSGVITARNIDTGALVKADADLTSANGTLPRIGLFGIARTDVLRIQVNVPQSYVGFVKEGQATSILVQEYPGKRFDGKIYRTAGALDAGTRTLLTEIHLDNRDGVLKPGMYAKVQFAPLQERVAIRVPAASLMIDAQGARIATVADGKIHWIAAHIGRDFGSEVEIASGLNGKETVVVNPTVDLVEGHTVNTVPLPPAAAGPGGH